MHGLGFVRSDLMLDVAALNKVELLPWDFWGLTTREVSLLTPAEWALLDRAAMLAAARDSELFCAYENEPALKVPRVIRSFQPAGVVDIGLAEECC